MNAYTTNYNNRHTDINKTKQVIFEYLQPDNKLNIDALVNQVEILNSNTEQQYNILKNTRIKNTNVALQWLLYFIKTELYFDGFKNYYATIQQIKTIEKSHPELITVIEELTKIVIMMRDDLDIHTK